MHHAPARRLLLALALVVATGVPLVAHAAPWGTGQSRPEDLEISLVTMDPGDAVPSWWGHGALLVEDRRLGVSRVYNYGMFDFGPDMLMNFLKGRLEFWAGDAPAGWTWRVYESLGRSIRLQVLDLPPEVRLETAAFLADNVRPENRTYLYHHYDDNCVTRVRDVLDRAVGGRLADVAAEPATMTLRDHTRRHAWHVPYMAFVLDLFLNDQVDRPITRWEEAFLPTELERLVDETTRLDAAGQPVPLVKRKVSLYDSGRPPVPEGPVNPVPGALAVGLLLPAVAFALGRWWQRRGTRPARWAFGLWQAAVGLALGLPGFILAAFYLTDHEIAKWNENLFLASPLTLLAGGLGLLLALGWRRAPGLAARVWQVQAALTLLGLALKALPAFDQDLSFTASLLVPVNLGFALALTAALRPATSAGSSPARSGGSRRSDRTRSETPPRLAAR